MFYFPIKHIYLITLQRPDGTQYMTETQSIEEATQKQEAIA